MRILRVWCILLVLTLAKANGHAGSLPCLSPVDVQLQSTGQFPSFLKLLHLFNDVILKDQCLDRHLILGPPSPSLPITVLDVIQQWVFDLGILLSNLVPVMTSNPIEFLNWMVRKSSMCLNAALMPLFYPPMGSSAAPQVVFVNYQLAPDIGLSFYHYKLKVHSNKIVYILETVDMLKLKLLHNKLKLNCAKNLRMQLLNLLNHISEDTNQIEHQLLTHINNMRPTSVYPESFRLQPLDVNSGLTGPTCFSHRSSTVDPYMDIVSSLKFSNFNKVVDANKKVRLVNEHPLVQPGFEYPKSPKFDPASVIFETLLKGKVLPEKGKLLHSVLAAGPLLHMLVFAGPLPMWRSPPPSQHINFVPLFAIKDRDIADMGNYADLEGASSSDSKLNFSDYKVRAIRRERHY